LGKFLSLLEKKKELHPLPHTHKTIPDEVLFYFFFWGFCLFLFERERMRESEYMRGGRVRGRGGLPAERGARCGT